MKGLKSKSSDSRIIILLLLFFSLKTQAQFAANDDISVSAGILVSTDSLTPFGLRANQYGTVPRKANLARFELNWHHEYDSSYTANSKKLKKFSYGYGLNAVTNIQRNSSFFLPEAYAKVRYGAFEFYAGRRKEIFGLVDTTATSGSYIWSGNAMPLPKFQIAIPNYIPILKSGLISIKGGFTHGWFGNDRLYTRNIKLHQKWFYGKLGKPSWKMHAYAGFNHQAQWGGYSPFYTVDGKLPDGFKNYLHVVMGTRGAITNSPETLDFDANRIGNHLGTIDLGLDFNIGESKFMLYRQNIYEDGSLFYLNNIKDGLNGVSWTNKNAGLFQKIGIEYLNTSDQGGDQFIFFATDGSHVPVELRGGDSYFFNGQIQDGWTNNNETIGTPFISIPSKNDTILNYSVQVFTLMSTFKPNNNLIATIRYSSSSNFGDKNVISKIYTKNSFLKLDLNYVTNRYRTILLNLAFNRSGSSETSFAFQLKCRYPIMVN